MMTSNIFSFLASRKLLFNLFKQLLPMNIVNDYIRTPIFQFIRFIDMLIIICPIIA